MGKRGNANKAEQKIREALEILKLSAFLNSSKMNVRR